MDQTQQILSEETEATYEDLWGYDGPDADGEIAREKYYDARACAQDWNTPPEYR